MVVAVISWIMFAVSAWCCFVKTSLYRVNLIAEVKNWNYFQEAEKTTLLSIWINPVIQFHYAKRLMKRNDIIYWLTCIEPKKVLRSPKKRTNIICYWLTDLKVFIRTWQDLIEIRPIGLCYHVFTLVWKQPKVSVIMLFSPGRTLYSVPRFKNMQQTLYWNHCFLNLARIKKWQKRRWH